MVEDGEEILIRNEKSKKSIAVLIPYPQYKHKKTKTAGDFKRDSGL
jgi:hypothetical protein